MKLVDSLCGVLCSVRQQMRSGALHAPAYCARLLHCCLGVAENLKPHLCLVWPAGAPMLHRTCAQPWRPLLGGGRGAAAQHRRSAALVDHSWQAAHQQRECMQ